jgi:hypothetical protein
MASWTAAELDEIERADELHLASRRADGSLRRPVTIWMVRVGDDVYVRGARGEATVWNRRAREAGSGHVTTTGGIDRDVLYEPVDALDADLADAITDAYNAKYAPKYPRPYIDPVVGPASLPTTLRVVAA